MELRVDRLPDHEIRQALCARLDEKIGLVGKDESLLDPRRVDGRRIEVSGARLSSQFPDDAGELAFAPESDAHLYGGVGALGVLGAANGDLVGGVYRPELALDGRHDGLVEDAHRERDALGPVFERPPEKLLDGRVGTLFEQVALRDNDRDALGRVGAVTPPEPVAEREIPVVRVHDRFYHRDDRERYAPDRPAAGSPERGSGEFKYPSGVAGHVTSELRRAGGFALVGTLALAAPALGRAAAVPFALVAVGAAFVVDEGPLFDLFARPGDRREGRLAGLAGFALAAAGLAVLATLPARPTAMPTTVYVIAVLVLSYGNLGEQAVRARADDPALAAAGFVGGGFAAGVAGGMAAAVAAETAVRLPAFAFLAASGALVAALLRSMLYTRDDPLVILSIGILLWGAEAVVADVSALEVGAALLVTVVLGTVSYVLETASEPGMLTGVLFGLLSVVLGGPGWFAVLITFFAVGGLAAKFRYEAKRERGVAEENEGARGTGNVLGNAAVALVALVGFAASDAIAVDAWTFRVAFAGSLAAAMSDTLSSEIGGLFDRPRLVTTLQPVDPGTDGGVTWQGTVAGVVGAALVAGVATILFSDPGVALLAVVVVGGVIGMVVDSVLGATVEGRVVGNEGVNLLATFAGAAASVGLALVLV